MQIEVKDLTLQFYGGSVRDLILMIWPVRVMLRDETCSEFSSDTADTLDQRLIHLTRLLARQAAREALAEIPLGTSTKTSKRFCPEVSDG